MLSSSRIAVRFGLPALLILALMVNFYGVIRGEGSTTYFGVALSLLLVDFIVERIILTERMWHFIEKSEKADSDNRKSLDLLSARLSTSEAAMNRYVVPFFPTLSSNHSSFDELRHVYALRGGTIISNGAGVEVERAMAVRLWRDCLLESSSWDALSSADDLWYDDEREISVAYQRLFSRLNNTDNSRRVFVFHDHNERISKLPLLEEQAELFRENNLRWIMRDELVGHLSRQKAASDELRELSIDLDFAIANRDYVLWFRISGSGEGRNISSARAIRDPKTLAGARRVFDIAFRNARSIRSLQDT